MTFGWRQWKMETVKNVLESIAIVLAGTWAVYTFWFQEIHEPAKVEVHLDIASQLERVSVRDVALPPDDQKRDKQTQKFIAIRGRITMKNSGRRVVKTLASWYNARAERIASTHAAALAPDDAEFGKQTQEFVTTLDGNFNTAREPQTRAGAKEAPPTETARRFSEPVDVPRFSYVDGLPQTVAAGIVTAPGYWFDINEETTREILFYVPATYDHVTLDAGVLITSDDKNQAVRQWHVTNDARVVPERKADACWYCVLWWAPANVYEPHTNAYLSLW